MDKGFHAKMREDAMRHASNIIRSEYARHSTAHQENHDSPLSDALLGNAGTHECGISTPKWWPPSWLSWKSQGDG